MSLDCTTCALHHSACMHCSRLSIRLAWLNKQIGQEIDKDAEITQLKTRLATIRRALELRDAIWDDKCDIDEISARDGAVLTQIEEVIAREAGEQ